MNTSAAMSALFVISLLLTAQSASAASNQPELKIKVSYSSGYSGEYVAVNPISGGNLYLYQVNSSSQKPFSYGCHTLAYLSCNYTSGAIALPFDSVQTITITVYNKANKVIDTKSISAESPVDLNTALLMCQDFNIIEIGNCFNFIPVVKMQPGSSFAYSTPSRTVSYMRK